MSATDPKPVNMLSEALGYLNAGLPVFPVCSPRMGKHDHNGQSCTSPGKRPLVSWEAYQSRLPTPHEVRSWWGRYPNANIGMATGALSRVVVLDCDSGEARQLAMSKGGLDKTPAVWTGKPGGIHYWLRHEGEEVRNFARRLPGTDLRGDGGYVLLPPSRHALGADYRWAENTQGMKAAPIPAWLHELLSSGAGGVTEHGESEIGEPLDLNKILEGIGQGERDDTLWKYAGKMRGDDVPQAYADQMIRQAARLCRPAFDEELAADMVRRAYKKFEPRKDFDSLIADDEDAVMGAAESEPAPDDGWKVFDAADFLKMEYPVVQWRIEGFLRDRAILFNFGAPGSIKTYIATDGGLAVATGGLFLGQYQCEQGRVLIVQEDTLDSDFQQAYLGPLVRARGIDPEELRGHLFIAPPGGMTLGVPERVQELCRWLEEYKPDLLILDAFYLMHDGEGYGKDLGPIMKRIKALRSKYGCAIWIIDHDRKGKAEASGSENPIDRLWGGRQKSAAVDAIVESRPIKGSHGETFLDVIKLRGAKPAEPIRVKLHEDYRLIVDGEGKAYEASPTGTKLAVYEWLCCEGGSRTKAQISSGVNLSLRAIEGALYELSRDGLAKKNGKLGRAETWIGLRKDDAEPITDAPDFDFEDDE